MIRFGFVAPSNANLFIKNLTKWCKSIQSVHRTFSVSVWDGQTAESNQREKLALYERIAREENLNFDDFQTKEQDQEEIESIFKEIAQGDGKTEQQLRFLLYEIMIRRDDGGQVPVNLYKRHWEELLKLQSLSKRNKYLTFLFITEKKRQCARVKEALRNRDRALFTELEKKAPHMRYGLGGNSLFFRIYPQTISKVQDLKALMNKHFAPPIIFDCSYQNYMDITQTKSCAKQIVYSIQENRTHPCPSTLQFFSLKEEDLLTKHLEIQMCNIRQNDSPCEIYDSSYLDLYPKERLVYLTPHTKNNLKASRSDDIYIIGAYVDKGYGVQASLAKAKEKGLRMAKIPIDLYCLWKQGNKSLTLNTVLKILLDLRYYNSWEKALKNLPSRNLFCGTN